MNPIDMKIRPGASNLMPEALQAPSKLANKGESFGALLNGLVDKVNTLQQDADSSIQGLVSGEETSVHNVAIKMEEAGIAFDLMMQVRNKLLEAYQEISRIQS